MFPLPQASTTNMRLDDVLAQLSRHPTVDGLVTIGSTARETLTAASDYDLLIILADPQMPFQVGVTSIDHRLTDLLFASTAQVEAILNATTDIDGNAWEGRVAMDRHQL
jgi:predicted nucleotidyltransferase